MESVLAKWFNSKRAREAELAKLIEERTDQYAAKSGVSHSQAEYFALCSVVDELKDETRPTAQASTFISLMSRQYGDQRRKVTMYMAWKTGVIDVGSEQEKELIALHGPWANQ